MSLIEVSGLWKRFGDHVVLENLNLVVAEHEFITLVGASGCGKSTFLRILLGAERPTRGQVLLEDQPLVPEPGPDRGIVFQHYSVFPHLTVLGNVLLGLELGRSPWLGRLFGQARRAARAHAEEMLEAVGLIHARHLYPGALSGGMRQRLSIAQSVIKHPRVLLLDEPFGALDPGISQEMHELVRRIWREHRLTVFMVTHDLKEAFELGTRLLVFDRLRDDPHAPLAYGATITYDVPLKDKRRPLEHLPPGLATGEDGCIRTDATPAASYPLSPRAALELQ